MTGNFARRDEEIAIIELAPEREDQIPPGGPICLQSLSPERLILIGEALAKSVVLARHEREVASVFDTTEPFARELAQSGRMRGSRRAILKHIGNALSGAAPGVGAGRSSRKARHALGQAASGAAVCPAGGRI